MYLTENQENKHWITVFPPTMQFPEVSLAPDYEQPGGIRLRVADT
jgi:hypothetical protein